MSQRYFQCLLFAGFLVACNPDAEKAGKSKGEVLPPYDIRPYSNTTTYFDYKNTRLAVTFTDTLFAKFSSDTSEDCFTIIVPDGLIVETQTQIKIANAQGVVIYEHTFPTSDLVNGYEIEKIGSDIEMEEYILYCAKEVFGKGVYNLNTLDDDAYLNQAPEADFNDYATFKHMKETNRLLFHYCLNEESHYYLGFSDAEKRVVRLIDCC